MQVEQTVQQAEAVLRFTQEVDRRLAEHGIAGVEDFLRRYAEFQRALGSVTVRELQWARDEADRLSRRLEGMCSELNHLRALKAALEVHH